MEVRFHKTFKKKFKKLPQKIQRQFFERLDLFMRDPLHVTLHNHSVERAFPGCRSINVTGDYRAIFYEQDQVTTFVTIGTHAELYS